MTTDMRNKIYSLRRFLMWVLTFGGASGVAYNCSDFDDGICEDTHDDELDPDVYDACNEDYDDYYEDY